MNETQTINAIHAFFHERDKGIPSDDMDLFESGTIDSMDLLELIVHLEASIGASVGQELMTVDNFRSVNRIIATFQG